MQFLLTAITTHIPLCTFGLTWQEFIYKLLRVQTTYFYIYHTHVSPNILTRFVLVNDLLSAGLMKEEATRST